MDEWTSGRVDEWKSGRVGILAPLGHHHHHPTHLQHNTTTHLVKRHWAGVFQLLVVAEHLDEAQGVVVLLVIPRVVVHTLEHRTCGRRNDGTTVSGESRRIDDDDDDDDNNNNRLETYQL